MRDEIIGLSDLEVLQSRAANGTNRVTAPPRESLIKRFMERLSDPIIIILIVALTLSVGVAIYQYFMGLEDAHIFLEPLGIFVAILLATLIGFLFEMRANKKFELLNSVSDDTMVKVMRSGQIREVAKCDVVVGDIIHLDSGDEIPSDAYLLEATSLQVNESSLTGEPMTHKCVIVNSECQETTYPQNLILRGTTIIEGHAVAKVIRVGDSTEYGKVYRGSQIDSGVKTPLNMQLDKLAKLITLISYIVAFVIIVGRMWIYFSGLHSFNLLDFGSYFLSTIMIAVTVIVVSVPEGLPMSVSLSLALSIQRMLKANNLVRKMHACETMGATTVICTDKTGTLTQNKMQIFETKFSDGVTPTMISKGIVLNSTAHLERCVDGGFKVLGNPTEGALLLWLEEQGEEYLRIREESIIVSQLPFSTERKYMASVVKSTTPGKNIIYVKGAPEVIVALSKGVCKESIEHDLCNYQSMAMRTLGFAYAEINDDVEPIKDGCVVDVDLIFVGIVAISDPIRTDVPEAVIRCRDAGIAIKIVTGDTMATAQEIARQIGLWGSGDSECNHLTGSQFEALSDEDLLERLDEIKILSRARPMDKQRMVKLLQQRGEVVAVTGDGTNDAPALKAAQIGLSMGDGTLVAKQASDITILDNSFSTISQSVMWGRSLYQNIQRFIL
ncbi:MAG: HAD-IC family P-type ATPase [Rikenellaceae bacterium]